MTIEVRSKAVDSELITVTQTASAATRATFTSSKLDRTGSSRIVRALVRVVAGDVLWSCTRNPGRTDGDVADAQYGFRSVAGDVFSIDDFDNLAAFRACRAVDATATVLYVEYFV